MSRKAAGSLLLLLLLVLVLVLAYWLASTTSEVRRQGALLDAEIEAIERDTLPRPPLFGDPVPGFAIDCYSTAERELADRCTFYHLRHDTRRALARLQGVFETMECGARTEHVGLAWGFRRNRARMELQLAPTGMMCLAHREDALRLARTGEARRAVDRLLVLVRYTADLRRCGYWSVAAGYIESTAESFRRLAPLLPRSQVQRAHGALCRERDIGAMGGFQRRAVLRQRQSMRLAYEGGGMAGYWLWASCGDIPRPLRRVVYRASELIHIPGALSMPVEEWSRDSPNPAIQAGALSLMCARRQDEAQARALEALVADLAARLRSS